MKILLVDDDSSIIQSLLPALRTLSEHEAHVAISGAKALERAPTIGGIDLLITDVVMEEMDGFTLKEQLQAWYPELKSIFISGYDLSGYAERIGGAVLLQKPFGPEELLSAVRQALGEANPVATAVAEAYPEPPIIQPGLGEESPELIASPVPEPVLEAVEESPEPVVQPALPEESPIVEQPADEAVPAEAEIHSAASQEGSPSVGESTGLAELAAGSFAAAPNLGGHAASEPESLPPVSHHQPVETSHAEPVGEPSQPVETTAQPTAAPRAVAATPRPVAVAKAAVPVARAATPTATPRVASAAAPVAKAAAPVARAAVPVAKAAAAAAVPVAKAAAAAVPVVKAVAQATPAAAVPVAQSAKAVPVARAAAATPVARPVAAAPTAAPGARVAAVPVAKAAAATPVRPPTAAAPTARPALAQATGSPGRPHPQRARRCQWPEPPPPPFRWRNRPRLLCPRPRSDRPVPRRI